MGGGWSAGALSTSRAQEAEKRGGAEPRRPKYPHGVEGRSERRCPNHLGEGESEGIKNKRSENSLSTGETSIGKRPSANLKHIYTIK